MTTPPPLNHTRDEWLAILRNNPRISVLAQEAIQDIVALHDALTSVLTMADTLVVSLRDDVTESAA